MTTLSHGRKIDDAQFKFLTQYLSNKYGLRIPDEKRVLLESRLSSRIGALKLNSVEEYLEYLFKSKNGDHEYQYFVEQVTTHKTSFFRENYQFEFLQSNLARYCSTFSTPRPIQVWSAGCSTGEEVYSIAITLEEKRASIPSLDYRIIGTDISVPSLKKAAEGIFVARDLENMTDYVREKYFISRQNGFDQQLQFTHPEMISKIKLGVLNLNNKQYNLPVLFDFIFCRNVTIYFDAKTRGEVLQRMVDKLKPGGYLFLGHSETAFGTSLPIKGIQPTIYQKL
ncbi:MAG TPA: CheR family methyltransferase [Chryseosolibacter sp.]